jgi:hypothetical protein
MVLHLGAWALLRLIRRRNARTAARFRESVRPVPLRGDGLDFSLQQQSRPFRIAMGELLAYPNGSMVEGPEPGGEERYQDIARDVIEREPTLARLPWLRKGRMFDEPDRGL